MIRQLLKLVFARLVPLLVLLVAILFGYFHSLPNPEGTFFTLLVPLMAGYIPPSIRGGFKPCPVVPPLPPDNDFTLQTRPTQETFVTLADGDDDDNNDGDPSAAVDDKKKRAFQMPQQGIGMCCRPTAYDAESVRRTILWYLKVGGRHIDTADLYQNHEWIGEALQIAMRDWNIPREDIFVTTKLWPRHFGQEAPMEAVPRMLRELKLDHVDMLLMHAPSHRFKFIGKKTECDSKGFSAKECRVETWKALSKVKQSGMVRHIGVSNFNIRQLKEIQELVVGDSVSVAPIANNQFQYNPWVPDFQHETFAYCREHNIAVTAWSSFAGSMMQHVRALTAETLQRIATNHNTTVAQVLLKWAMQKGAIVIPGTGNPKHMEENLGSYGLILSDDEMTEIDALKDDDMAKEFFVAPQDES